MGSKGVGVPRAGGLPNEPGPLAFSQQVPEHAITEFHLQYRHAYSQRTCINNHCKFLHFVLRKKLLYNARVTLERATSGVEKGSHLQCLVPEPLPGTSAGQSDIGQLSRRRSFAEHTIKLSIMHDISQRLIYCSCNC